MGQEQYIIRTGVGFDVDRRSGQQALGIMETIADSMNTMQMKKSVQGIQARNTKLQKANEQLEKDDAQAQKNRVKAIEKSASAAGAALGKAIPDEPEKLTPKTGKVSKAWTRWRDQITKMEKHYSKFADRAQKMGQKVAGSITTDKSGKAGARFMKQEAEDRQRNIVLIEKMIDENKELAEVKGKAGEEAKADNKALIKEMKAMKALDKEALALEKKEAKEKRKNYKEFSKKQKKLIRQNKQELQDIKTRTNAYKKMGAAAQNYVSGLAGGMKNAFVIGSAAAAAFAYKLQPVVESVMDFEKTIINANSVFGETQEKLHEVSDSLVTFGLQYGVSTQQAAEGLYQLASAGLDAADSQEVLQHTLKLAMATQGDHNTLAKLTVQTIAGFGMEMSQAEELTDKFAFSIQKSLIEWQDLSSSVKFAMPFFVATGQSIDQLLGGLQVLTNRALEAGIAGRGLRQALAQFTKHAEENESAFRKMGIEILDAEGKMKELSTIAKEAQQVFGDVEDYKVLTAMLEDLNVRGATAFALLVQNADEYQTAVADLANSAGEATRMADIQQESLANQIQRVKNALMAPFFFSDKIGEAGNSLNEFTLRIKELVDEFVGFLIIEEEGSYKLNEFGYQLQEFVIAAMNELIVVIRELKSVFLDASGSDGGLETFTKLLQLSTKPMLLTLQILEKLGPNFLTMLVYYKVLAKLIPFNTIMTLLRTKAELGLMLAIANKNDEEKESVTLMSAMGLSSARATIQNGIEALSIWAKTAAMKAYNLATLKANISTKAMFMSFGAAIGVMMLAVNTTGKLSDALTVLAGILVMVSAYKAMKAVAGIPVVGPVLAVAAAAAIIKGAFMMRSMLRDAFGIEDGGGGGVDAIKKIGAGSLPDARSYDMGGIYMPTMDTGGPTPDHGMAILQKGETVVPKTQNQLGGGGITVNMGDVHAEDGTDFAEKLAEALPQAIRRQNDMGVI